MRFKLSNSNLSSFLSSIDSYTRNNNDIILHNHRKINSAFSDIIIKSNIYFFILKTRKLRLRFACNHKIYTNYFALLRNRLNSRHHDKQKRRNINCLQYEYFTLQFSSCNGDSTKPTVHLQQRSPKF